MNFGLRTDDQSASFVPASDAPPPCCKPIYRTANPAVQPEQQPTPKIPAPVRPTIYFQAVTNQLNISINIFMHMCIRMYKYACLTKNNKFTTRHCLKLAGQLPSYGQTPQSRTRPFRPRSLGAQLPWNTFPFGARCPTTLVCLQRRDCPSSKTIR